MHPYAQTNVQLFNQLSLDVYTHAELRRIRATYDLAASLFSGHLQASGKPLLAHVVGVASILNALGAPPALVAAGLIHSVYRNGEFGCGRRGMSDRKRQVVAATVGDEVERYAARFATMPWSSSTFTEIHARLDVLDPLDRDVVLLHLADHLEHQLDLDVFYHGNIARRDTMRPHHDVLLQMASRLGFPQLVDELRGAHARADFADVPPELRGTNRASLVPPWSYRRRVALRLRNRLTNHVGRLRSVLGRGKRLVTTLRAKRNGLDVPAA
jgi:(p)ppGpp synthase/HD superfamily hydrolase